MDISRIAKKQRVNHTLGSDSEDDILGGSRASSDESDLARVLRRIYGYDSFRGQQEEIIQHVVDGNDALVLMPTGAGKSLCYQLPAIVRHEAGHGVAIVVSPLIALMQDQVSRLNSINVPARFLNSTLEKEDAIGVQYDMIDNKIAMLYLSPERMMRPKFLKLLVWMYQRERISMFAIDEAHCVSQWGHDFRPEYQKLSILNKEFPSVPRVALTATADAATREDIAKQLHLTSACQFVSSFDRPNIRYTVVEKKNSTHQLIRFIQAKHLGDSGIVYCLSRRRVESVTRDLVDAGFNAVPYHAGLDNAAREANQRIFLNDSGVIVVATIAFGMGIDKPDVRFVAHLDLPKNIEGYYQETGRAGRDGGFADAWMAYGLTDVMTQQKMINEGAASDDFKSILHYKLDALLAFAETGTCRRDRLLNYFGERYVTPASMRYTHATGVYCGNCDNCLNPPVCIDVTKEAQALLSTIYHIHQKDGLTFNAEHLANIIRGKLTDKVKEYAHDKLNTFGLLPAQGEGEIRIILRQLLGMNAIRIDSNELRSLTLSHNAQDVLRGDVSISLKNPDPNALHAAPKPHRVPLAASSAYAKTPFPLDESATLVFLELKAWRGQIARKSNTPAFMVLPDTALAELAQKQPKSIDEIKGLNGFTEKKIYDHGEAVLRIIRSVSVGQMVEG